MATQFYPRSRPPSESTLRVQALLARYPNLSEQELAELINLFHYLRLLDVGLMSADDRLSDKLADFRRDHGHALVRPREKLIMALALSAIFVLGLAWLVLS